MAKSVTNAPFPPMKWDGAWRGKCQLPWLPSAGDVDLIVSMGSQASGAVPPTTAQAAAYQYLVDGESKVPATLLAAFKKYLPEFEAVETLDPQGVLEIAEAIVFHAEADDVAYLGFIFNSMEYEHGIGLVIHRDRVVHIGNAEEAAEELAAKDSRRRKRSARK